MHDDDDRRPAARSSSPGAGDVEAGPASVERPASPCTEVCTLDDEDCCVGCFRMLDEIIRWSVMSPAEQWSVVDAVAERRASRGR